jgi:hypothetical protein
MKNRNIILSAVIVIVAVSSLVFVFDNHAQPKTPDKLAVLWTSGDPEVAHKVCFMYTLNAKKQRWFDQVNLIVWGPSSRLLAGDKDIQAKVKQMQEAGVIVEACQACADSYGVSDKLRQLGIEVKYMGLPLSNMLKSDYKMLNF